MRFKDYRKYILSISFLFLMVLPCSAQLGQGFFVIKINEKFTIETYTVINISLKNESDCVKLAVAKYELRNQVSINLNDQHKFKNIGF